MNRSADRTGDPDLTGAGRKSDETAEGNSVEKRNAALDTGGDINVRIGAGCRLATAVGIWSIIKDCNGGLCPRWEERPEFLWHLEDLLAHGRVEHEQNLTLEPEQAAVPYC